MQPTRLLVWTGLGVLWYAGVLWGQAPASEERVAALKQTLQSDPMKPALVKPLAVAVAVAVLLSARAPWSREENFP